MLAASLRRSSSVFRGAARVTGTRYFAVSRCPCFLFGTDASDEMEQTRAPFKRQLLDIRDDATRARWAERQSKI